MEDYSWTRLAAEEKVKSERYKLASGCLWYCKHAVFRNEKDKDDLMGMCARTRVPDPVMCPVLDLMCKINSKVILASRLDREIKEHQKELEKIY